MLLLKRVAIYVLLPCIVAVIFGFVKPSPIVWTTDSAIYARIMLSDVHAAAPDQAFSTWKGSNYFQIPAHRDMQEFKDRALYPWLASLLYASRGYQALVDVSRIAYIVACILTCVLIGQFTRASVANLCALLFAVWPLVRSMASSALTDMLSLCLWIAVLLAMVVALRTQRPAWLIALTILTAALAFARPMTYYPFAVALTMVAICRNRTAYALAAIVAGVTAVYGAISIGAGFTGLIEHLLYLRNRDAELGLHPNPVLGRWWLTSFTNVCIMQLKHAIRLVYPAAIFLAAAVGIYMRRNAVATAIFVGALIASVGSVALNPKGWDFARTVELPFLPALLLGIGLLLEAALAFAVNKKRHYAAGSSIPIR